MVKRKKYKTRVITSLTKSDLRLMKTYAANRIVNRRIVKALSAKMGYQNFNRRVNEIQKEMA